jgi:VanZ family protein
LSREVGTGELELSPARRAAAWLPVVLWLALIVWFSQGSFSADWSLRGMGPLARFLGLTPEQRVLAHLFIRKGAHVVEYAVLAFLAYRAASLSLPALSLRAAAGVALGVALTVATTDEWHQSYLTTRTGKPRDVALDLAGAGLGLAAWRLLAPRLR